MATICEEQFSGSHNSQCTTTEVNPTDNTLGLKLFAVTTIAYKALVNRYRTKQEQRINRDAFKHMLTLSDELLDDIGVSRYDVRWAANLPLSVDAACALREVSKGASPECRRGSN